MAMDDITGPLTQLLPALYEALAEHLPRDLTWPVLLLTLGLASSSWFIRGGIGAKGADGRVRKMSLLEFLLPLDIYSHVSARVDIGLYVLERFLRPLWVATLLVGIAPGTETLTLQLLTKTLGAGPGLQSNAAWMLLYSLVTLLIYDFVFYATHYAEHKIPALWAIHKIHHSAEVLTPLTRYREHFLEGPIYAAGSAVSFGLAGGIFGWLFAGDITQATLFNLGFFAVLLGFNGSFRHYHVGFHYPSWRARWLHSPAMHHTHHSYLEPHWDTNLAAVTSIWDRLFGTLYIPKKDEYTPWGLGPAHQDRYRSLWQNVSGPFRDWSQMLRQRDKLPKEPS